MVDIYGKEIVVCGVPCLQIIPTLAMGKRLSRSMSIFYYAKDKQPYLVFEAKHDRILYYAVDRDGDYRLLAVCGSDGCLHPEDKTSVHPVLYRPALLPLDKDKQVLDTLLCNNSRVRFGVFSYDGLVGGDMFGEPLAHFADFMEDGDLVIRDRAEDAHDKREQRELCWRGCDGMVVSEHVIAQTSLEWLFLHGLLPCRGMAGAETKVSI